MLQKKVDINLQLHLNKVSNIQDGYQYLSLSQKPLCSTNSRYLFIVVRVIGQYILVQQSRYFSKNVIENVSFKLLLLHFLRIVFKSSPDLHRTQLGKMLQLPGTKTILWKEGKGNKTVC